MQRMETGLATLGLLGNTAPLLGLLGTISGMIKAFMVIELAGGKVDAQALAGGIWEAMITTGVGLAVAIPLLIMLHLLEGAVRRRIQSMDNCLSLMMERRNGVKVPRENLEEPHHWEEITDGV
jgi:biopolymer transport protein ExbB